MEERKLRQTRERAERERLEEERGKRIFDEKVRVLTERERRGNI